MKYELSKPKNGMTYLVPMQEHLKMMRKERERKERRNAIVGLILIAAWVIVLLLMSHK